MNHRPNGNTAKKLSFDEFIEELVKTLKDADFSEKDVRSEVDALVDWTRDIR